MAETAVKYVAAIEDHLQGLFNMPDMDHFTLFRAVCESSSLDPDVVSVINQHKETAKPAVKRMQEAIDARTPEGDYLFRCNGFAAIINRSGLVAVHSALVHIENPVDPDPVYAVHEDYSSAAIFKAARMIVSEAHPDTKWPTLGQGYANGEYAGVTGGLFMHGVPGMLDIRAQLLTDPVVAEDIRKRSCISDVEIMPIDQIAGLADQYRAEIVAGIAMPPSVMEIQARAVDTIKNGTNIH